MYKNVKNTKNTNFYKVIFKNDLKKNYYSYYLIKITYVQNIIHAE